MWIHPAAPGDSVWVQSLEEEVQRCWPEGGEEEEEDSSRSVSGRQEPRTGCADRCGRQMERTEVRTDVRVSKCTIISSSSWFKVTSE